MSEAVIVPVVGSVDELGYFDGTASAGDRLYLAGYYPYDTRGGGLLYWDGDTTSAADDFVIFLDNAIPKRRWKRVPGLGPIDAHMAGAHGDGVINSSGWVDRTVGHDDTVAIQKVFDYFKKMALGDPYDVVQTTMRIGEGKFRVDGCLDLTGKSIPGFGGLRGNHGWALDGSGAVLLGCVDGRPVLDMTDARFGTLKFLQIYGSAETYYKPSCGIRIGRIEDNKAANGHHFYRCTVNGYYKLAAVHNIASEQFTEIGCQFANSEAGATYGYFGDGVNLADWALPLTAKAVTVTGSTVAVETNANHLLSTNDRVMLTGIEGLTNVNSVVLSITRIDAKNFQFTRSNVSGTYSSGGRVFKQLFYSPTYQDATTLTPWIQHSFKEQTHISSRIRAVSGVAAMFETGDSFHWMRQCHLTCGFFTPIGAVAQPITGITAGSPLVLKVSGNNIFSIGQLVYLSGLPIDYKDLNGRIFRVTTSTNVGGDTTFQLTDLYNASVNGAGTYGQGATATLQTTNGGYGMRMVISDSGLQQCDYDFHHEPGDGANGVLFWGKLDSMEAMRDGGTAPVALEDCTLREIVAHGQGGFLSTEPLIATGNDSTTVSSVTLHGGGVHVTRLRTRFGGESVGDKLLVPPSKFTVKGSELVVEQAAASPATLAAFSGRYSVEQTNLYMEKSDSSAWGLLDARTVAWLTRVQAFGSNPSSRARTFLYDDLVASLVAAGVWDLLDGLYLFAAHGQAAARVNLINIPPPATLIANPTFTADRGFAGTGSSAYLDTGVNVGRSGGRFTENSASMGVVSRSTAQNNSYRDIGLLSGNRAFVNASDFTGNLSTRGNDAFTATVASSSAQGFFAWSRTGSGSYTQFVGRGTASSPSTNTVANTAAAGPLTSNVVFLMGDGTNFSARQLSAGFFGAGLTTTQMNNLYSALKVYLSAVGAWL